MIKYIRYFLLAYTAKIALLEKPKWDNKISQWKIKFQQISSKHQINWRIPMAIAMGESSLNPYVIGIYGEMGLMQILPQTASLYNRDVGLTGTNDTYNIETGIIILKDLLSKHNFLMAINRYNSSSKSVLENWHYVSKFLKHFSILLMS